MIHATAIVSDSAIIADDVETTRARLALIEAVRMVIASGLAILGVEPAEEMR